MKKVQYAKEMWTIVKMSCTILDIVSTTEDLIVGEVIALIAW